MSYTSDLTSFQDHWQTPTVYVMDLANRSATWGDDDCRGRGGVVRRSRLFAQLDAAPRVIQVSAPAGSGKTVLVRSWISSTGLQEQAAWAAVDDHESDPQHFWLSVVAALRRTSRGSTLVKALTAAPDLDGWTILERVLRDLAPLNDRVWLVIDDAHEVKSPEILQQLQLLIMRAPPQLRLVLLTRRDLRLGLQRLRLEGNLAELRSADLRFSLTEAREMFGAVGIQPSEAAMNVLYERTEGWAAGLRLAAMSLSGYRDPEQFAAEFSGSERMVAEYLLTEVLERLSEPVRRLLLRTSLLERVNGELADLLTGESGGEQILQDLEQAGAFVLSLDVGRTWFRYHHLFAGLLRRELRHASPDDASRLHLAAARWFADHDCPVEGVRHAQLAGAWELAARMLFDGWLHITLDGQQDTAHKLLADFPVGSIQADPELLTLQAADELNQADFAAAELHLAQAGEQLGVVASQRRGRLRVTLGILRLSLARHLGDLPVVAEEAQRLLAPAAAAGEAGLAMSGERRAHALISLGIAETWTHRHTEAELHLTQGMRLAREMGWPYLELLGRAHSARVALGHSLELGARQSMEAIEMARQHGWSEQPIAGVAYTQLANAELNQGRVQEAGRWLDRAHRILWQELEPAAGMNFHWIRAAFELASGRPQWALDEFRAAEHLAGLLRAPHIGVGWMRAHALQTRLRLGETGYVGGALAKVGEAERETAAMRTVVAGLRLVGDDPQAATLALAPVIDGTVPAGDPVWLMEVLLLDAVARDALGDQLSAWRALDAALSLAEPDRMLYPFIIHPEPELLRRYAGQSTAHNALIARLLALLDGASQVWRGSAALPGRTWALRQPLSQAEMRVLRYLPTSLTVPEIGAELYLSANTIRTHMRHLYDKLDVHRRHEAVDRARLLGFIAPPPHGQLDTAR